MDLEKDIRAIYESFYNLCTVLGDPRGTEAIWHNVRGELTNGIPTMVIVRYTFYKNCTNPDVHRLLHIVHVISEEYRPKFYALIREQYEQDEKSHFKETIEKLVREQRKQEEKRLGLQ